MYEQLIHRLANEGDVPIGDGGVWASRGRIEIEARERTEMTLNQTVGALIALAGRERLVDYWDCVGDIYTSTSWQAQESIGFVAAWFA